MSEGVAVEGVTVEEGVWDIYIVGEEGEPHNRGTKCGVGKGIAIGVMIG